MENIDTSYGTGRRVMAEEMIAYCEKKITEINAHPKSPHIAIHNKRVGLITAYGNIIDRLNIKLKRMAAKLETLNPKQ
jgi:hypothetical protein